MPPTGDLDVLIGWAAVVIETMGAFLVVVAGIRGLAGLVLTGGATSGIIRARLLLADGVLAALGFKTAATLLKTLELRSWNAIAFFATVLALRTLVKQGFAWEVQRVQANALRRGD